MMISNSTRPQGAFARALFYALQPMLLVGVIAAWYADPTNPNTYLIALLSVQVVLGFAELFFPARPTWTASAKIRLRNVLIVMVLLVLSGAVGELYRDWLAGPLAELRRSFGLDVWPHSWPLLVQLFMVFLMNEFLWYWVHRAEHRWRMVWRVSGHGAHHSFKKLGALNFGLNHPLELFFLLLPSALMELTFGIGAATAGAAILLITQASIAHANTAMNTRWIGLVFTTNSYHICHHSADLAQSNTNYGCAAIIWDRVFGTFLDEPIVDAGTGPTEPTMWRKFLMPLQEPEDSAVAPGARRQQ
jgi:sterol desaturase/sphingolipid hydroxylase (fatty acid hydroxylase superfamily)